MQKGFYLVPVGHLLSNSPFCFSRWLVPTGIHPRVECKSVRVVSFRRFTYLFVRKFLFRVSARRFRFHLAGRLTSIFRHSVRLTSRPCSGRTFLPTSDYHAKGVGSPPIVRDRTFNPFRLQDNFLLLNDFRSLIQVNINNCLRFVISQNNVTFKANRRNHVRVSRCTSRINPSANDDQVAITPIHLSVRVNANIIRRLMVLIQPIRTNSLLSMIPLASSTICKRTFPTRRLSRRIRCFNKLLLSARICRVPVRTANGRRATVNVFRCSVQRTTIATRNSVVIFIHFMTVSFRSGSNVRE